MIDNLSTDLAEQRNLPDASYDPVGTVRVHPDDDPRDPHARRRIRTSLRMCPWAWLTGAKSEVQEVFQQWDHALVRSWPVQSLHELAELAGHQPAPPAPDDPVQEQLRAAHREIARLGDARGADQLALRGALGIPFDGEYWPIERLIVHVRTVCQALAESQRKAAAASGRAVHLAGELNQIISEGLSNVAEPAEADAFAEQLRVEPVDAPQGGSDGRG